MKPCALLILLCLPCFVAKKPSSAAPNADAGKAEALISDARLTQSDTHLAQMEKSLSELVNAQRAKAGLKPLAYDMLLSDVARGHSLEMRDHNYFAHVSPNDEIRTAVDRYKRAFGSVPPIVAENLYGAWGGKPRELSNADMQRAHDSLMRSPTHRQNILCARLTHIGIGLVTNCDGEVWVTQMFICAK